MAGPESGKIVHFKFFIWHNGEKLDSMIIPTSEDTSCPSLNHESEEKSAAEVSFGKSARGYYVQCDYLSDAIYEKAYIYYRRNQNVEALAELAKGDEDEIRFMELKAQLYYRLEKSEEALELLESVIHLKNAHNFTWGQRTLLFRKIINTHSDENDDVRRTNYIAALVQFQSKTGESRKEEIPLELDTFEQLYNKACQFIESEHWTTAVELLDNAAGRPLQSPTLRLEV